MFAHSNLRARELLALGADPNSFVREGNTAILALAASSQYLPGHELKMRHSPGGCLCFSAQSPINSGGGMILCVITEAIKLHGNLPRFLVFEVELQGKLDTG